MSDTPHQTLLLTGGTGSLGRAYLEHGGFKGRIRVYSRDEQKHNLLRQAIGDDPGIQLILGDVRDPEKLAVAMMDVTHVIHAAALKIIPDGAYNPDEFIKTNVNGTANVVRAAQMAGVKKLIYVSTDKGVEPTTLYGATKMISESLCVEANRWAMTRVSVVRYGNVVGSRGSFTNTISRAESDEVLKVTDPACTRFWITLEAAVKFIDLCFDEMRGGEIFVPRLPSKILGDMIPDGQPVEIVGLRAMEKLHETLIGWNELRRTDDKGEYFVVRPWPHKGTLVANDPYRSDSPEDWGRD